MKSLAHALVIISTLLALASCSCAIYSETWEGTRGSTISNTSFHQAAKDLGFESHHTSMHGYRKRDVYFYYSDGGKVSLYSSFCPTPVTLITSGADADAWDARCNDAKDAIHDWYSHRGITFEKVSLLEEQNAALIE